MHLYLVRHGQSEGNLARPDAPHDPPLTPVGHAQAARVAAALTSLPIAAVYASPVTRALQTAAPIGRALDLPVRVWPCLSETARGDWNAPENPVPPFRKSGLFLREVREQFPGTEFSGDIDDDAPWWESLAGERRAGAYARAARALAMLAAAHPAGFGKTGLPGIEESLIAITHGAFGSVLISAALNTPPTDYNRYSQYNCGISLIYYTESEIRLRYLNSVEHLSLELRTDLT